MRYRFLLFLLLAMANIGFSQINPTRFIQPGTANNQLLITDGANNRFYYRELSAGGAFSITVDGTNINLGFSATPTTGGNATQVLVFDDSDDSWSFTGLYSGGSTSSLLLPSGTIAERPVDNIPFQLRGNSEINLLEFQDPGGVWQTLGNIANANLTFTGARTHDLAGFDLTISQTSGLIFKIDNSANRLELYGPNSETIIGFEAEASNLGTAYGYQAGKGNTGSFFTAGGGYQAGLNNTADNVSLGGGYQIGASNTGRDLSVGAGYQAGSLNTGGFVSIGAGYQAGRNNNQLYLSIGAGWRAGLNNTGSFSAIATGFEAGVENSGQYLAAGAGFRSAAYNSGHYLTTTGGQSGLQNRGNNNSFYGYLSGRYVTKGKVTAIGSQTIAYHNSAAGVSTLQSAVSGNAITVPDATIYGDIGEDVFIHIDRESGSSDISPEGSRLFTVTNSTTVTMLDGTITATSNSETFLLSPHYNYENITVLGALAVPSKGNQISLGDNLVNSLLLGSDEIYFKTGHFSVPTGTTLQRSTGAAGRLRWNTDLTALEFHNGTDWIQVGTATLPTFTEGSVIFADSNGDLTEQGASRFHWNSTRRNLTLADAGSQNTGYTLQVGSNPYATNDIAKIGPLQINLVTKGIDTGQGIVFGATANTTMEFYGGGVTQSGDDSRYTFSSSFGPSWADDKATKFSLIKYQVPAIVPVTTNAQFNILDLTHTGNIFVDPGSSSDVVAINYSTPSVTIMGSGRHYFLKSDGGNVHFGGTGATKIHSGTDSQRPPTQEAGMIRYNTTLGGFEGSNGVSWNLFSTSVNTNFVTHNLTFTTDRDHNLAGYNLRFSSGDIQVGNFLSSYPAKLAVGEEADGALAFAAGRMAGGVLLSDRRVTINTRGAMIINSSETAGQALRIDVNPKANSGSAIGLQGTLQPAAVNTGGLAAIDILMAANGVDNSGVPISGINILPSSISNGADYRAIFIRNNSGYGIYQSSFSIDNLINGSLTIGQDVTLSNYADSRDDSGATTPLNFLYTNSSGNLLSAPVSSFGGGGPEFPDNTFRVYDEIDNTKKLAFSVSKITTGQTRTVDMPNYDVSLGVLPNLSQFTSYGDVTTDISGRLTVVQPGTFTVGSATTPTQVRNKTVVTVDGTGGSFTQSMSSSDLKQGDVFYIKSENVSTNNVTINIDSGTVDVTESATTGTNFTLSTNNELVMVIWLGSEAFITRI